MKQIFLITCCLLITSICFAETIEIEVSTIQKDVLTKLASNNGLTIEQYASNIVTGWANSQISGYYINTIKKDGFEVVVRGQGWPGGQASFEEMVDLYSRSKIVLGFSRTSSDYKTYSIKGRDFEVLMCGAFYMCEKNPELCDWFKPNNEIVFWDNIRDLLPKIRFYLKCEKRRQTIACMGHFRAATEHTWMDRFETLFWYLKEHLGIEN